MCVAAGVVKRTADLVVENDWWQGCGRGPGNSRDIAEDLDMHTSGDTSLGKGYAVSKQEAKRSWFGRSRLNVQAAGPPMCLC